MEPKQTHIISLSIVFSTYFCPIRIIYNDKSINPSVLPTAMSKIVGQTFPSSLGKATSIVERKTLKSDPAECGSGKPLAHLCSIVLLSTYSKNEADSTKTLNTIKKINCAGSPMVCIQ